MSHPDHADTIRFYFSFRSPYAWLATERLDAELGGLGVPIERVPVFPSPELFPNDPSRLPAKSQHLLQDVPRLAREQGLTVRFPTTTDTDWALAHAAVLAAREQGDEARFTLEVFRKRFSEGQDVGDEAVLADAAERAGLDAAALLEGARSPRLQAEAKEAWRRGMERDGLFGVPTFIYAGRIYWGQDRMRFLRSAVERKRGAGASAPALTPEKVARALMARIEAGDVEGAAALYDEDCVTWRNLDGRELGKRQVTKILVFLAGLKDLRYEDVRIQETGEGFVQQHALVCRAPGGEAVRAEACLVGRVRDGRIQRLDEYLDSAAMAPLLG